MRLKTNRVKAAVLLTYIITSIQAVNLYAASIEGYWKSMDDQTGQPLSIIEIKKTADGTYTGTISHRYPNAVGYVLNNCEKCAPPLKGKPLVGLPILTGLKDDPKKANSYVDGNVLDARTGKVYKGKGYVSADGRKAYMRGYVGASVFGRTQVWIRTEKGTP